MEIQKLLFGLDDQDARKYSGKIDGLIYSPRGAKPNPALLVDRSKVDQLLSEIDAAELEPDEKDFLRAAAWRHAVFHYEQIAEFYAHSSDEIQRLMENSALVVVDFGSAIEGGFVAICEAIERQYRCEYDADAK